MESTPVDIRSSEFGSGVGRLASAVIVPASISGRYVLRGIWLPLESTASIAMVKMAGELQSTSGKGWKKQELLRSVAVGMSRPVKSKR
jgi:hypothetical protein